MVRKLICKDCKNKFTLTEEEQNWYKDKNFEFPKRCLTCRKTRRENMKGENNNGKKKN